MGRGKVMYRLGVPSVILRDRDVPPGEEDPTGGFPGAKGDPRRTEDRTGERERRGRVAEEGITGHSPVVVHPKIVSSSPEQGNFYEAPYGVGESASILDGNTRLTLTVVQQFESCYHVKLTYVRQ